IERDLEDCAPVVAAADLRDDVEQPLLPAVFAVDCFVRARDGRLVADDVAAAGPRRTAVRVSAPVAGRQLDPRIVAQALDLPRRGFGEHVDPVAADGLPDRNRYARSVALERRQARVRDDAEDSKPLGSGRADPGCVLHDWLPLFRLSVLMPGPRTGAVVLARSMTTTRPTMASGGGDAGVVSSMRPATPCTSRSPDRVRTNPLARSDARFSSAAWISESARPGANVSSSQT